MKSVLWRVAKRLSYIEDACFLKVKLSEIRYDSERKELQHGIVSEMSLKMYS